MAPDIGPVDPVGTVTRAEREAAMEADHSEHFIQNRVTILDEREYGPITLDALCDPAPAPGPHDWNAEGVLSLPGFVPDRLIDAYCECWVRENTYGAGQSETRWEGWPDATPYMRHEELRDLFCWEPLTEKIGDLIGEEPGVHLNLTGWVTTQRDWHQDQYLNEPGVNDAYAAVWIALDDIHPDSGPFQYVPGSHRWPQVDRGRLLDALGTTKANPNWPRDSERLLSPLFEAEIAARRAEVVTYLPKRGDVLIWHSRLLHRGSKANVPGMERRATIAHYSGLSRRNIDMHEVMRWRRQGHYFVLNGGPRT